MEPPDGGLLLYLIRYPCRDKEKSEMLHLLVLVLVSLPLVWMEEGRRGSDMTCPRCFFSCSSPPALLFSCLTPLRGTPMPLAGYPNPVKHCSLTGFFLFPWCPRSAEGIRERHPSDLFCYHPASCSLPATVLLYRRDWNERMKPRPAFIGDLI